MELCHWLFWDVLDTPKPFYFSTSLSLSAFVHLTLRLIIIILIECESFLRENTTSFYPLEKALVGERWPQWLRIDVYVVSF